MESSEDLFAAIDDNYRYLFANEAYRNAFLSESNRLRDCSVGEVLGEEFFENHVKPKVDRCLRGENVRYEMARNTSDGKERQFEMSYHPLKDENGEIIGVAGVAKDITERKEAEKRFKRLFDSSPDPVYFVDESGEIQETNGVFAEKIGYSRDEIVGTSLKKPVDFLPEESREKVVDAFKRRLKGEEVSPYTIEVETKDGETLYTEINASRMVKEGKTVGVIGIARDITERKKLEKKYTFESNLLNSLLDNADDLVYFKDREGRYLKVSEAYAEALDLDRKEMEGKTVFDLFPEDQAKEMHEDDSRVMEEGRRVVDREHKITLSDGETRWLSTTKVPRYDDEGNIIGMVGISRDITERREAEDREELLHSLLRHDLRNKTQIVQGYLELLEDFDLPEEAKKFVEKARKGTREGADLIEKVRILRKAQKGEEVREVGIDKVVHEAVDQVRPMADDRGIEIEVDCPGEGCKVLGGSLLNRVFSNIVENAILHSGCSKIRIHGVSTEGEVMCAIEDDSKGISDDEKDKIFEKGYTTDEERGTGLGMFLVQTLLEIYGGSIKVKDSELGGARFDVHLQKA